MKIRLMTLCLLVVACGKPTESYSPASGSLGISRDDALLYAADSDNNALLVIDSTNESLVQSIPVGRQPEKVLVGTDDSIYVTNRYGRSVGVIRRGEWKVASTIAVGVEPVGLAQSTDGRTLYVVNAAMVGEDSVGSLMAIDTGTGAISWELPIGQEPRAIAVVGHKALVTLYKAGDVVTVDLDTHTVLRSGTDVYAKLNQGVLSTNTGGAPVPDFAPGGFQAATTVHPRGFESISVTPDGKQAFVTGLLASDTVLPGGPATADATNSGDKSGLPGQGGDIGYGGSSTCGGGAVAAPALLTFDGEGNSTAADVTSCQGQSVGFQPPQVLGSGIESLPMQGPAAAAIDPTGAFTFVVNRDSNNVAIVSNNSTVTNGGDVVFSSQGKAPTDSVGGAFRGAGSATAVTVGNGPTGIALARDGARAWVYNSFDHSISRLEKSNGVVQATHTNKLAEDTLTAAEVSGRKLFFSATDSRMNSLGTGISCATCHLEGREDGQVWNFTDGPRQTPMLAGRQLDKTAPFHWNGEFQSFTSFMSHTVTHRMGGSGASPAMEGDLQAFIRQMPLPDNANKFDAFTPSQARGQIVFAKAQCNTCHSGEALTNNAFDDVGTLVVTGALKDTLPTRTDGLKGFNVPSLLGVGRTAPYLHDGSAATLEARIIQGKETNLHGQTAQLSGDEVSDLVQYLKTL